MKTPTIKTAHKIIDILSHGLSSGLGTPKPGEMCVEAAVCYAMDLPHSDKPNCVAESIRKFKIGLNDCNWSSNQARANGLRKLAVAQLGSNTINENLFVSELALGIIRKILPVILKGKVSNEILQSCKTCTNLETGKAARAAAWAADAAHTANAAHAAARAAAHAADAANAAARAAADAAAWAAARAAGAAARAAAHAADAADINKDNILLMFAKVGLQALIKCKSPGCKWLYLCK